ncbi:MAG: DUF433 domain-containing protein [Planctomycetota bacterium]
MDWRDHIERRTGVAGGRPVFKGTRLTVEFVLERLSQGARAESLVASHPPLTESMIQAALAYAVSTVRQDEVLLSA